MTSEGPSLGDQVTRLYELIGGYHATQLLEIGRELGVWRAVTARPGVSSEELAATLATDGFYTDVLLRTAFSFGLVDREGGGWRMAPHFDQILGNPDSSFFLEGAAKTHMLVGEDYADFVRHFRDGSTKTYQQHDERFMAVIAEGLKTLPRIFLDFVLPQLPELDAQLSRAERLLDVGCGGGWALVQFAERYAGLRCVGVDLEPTSIDLAQRLILERGLVDRCAALLVGAEELKDAGIYDIATSFLVIHEIEPAKKAALFAAVARALKPGGSFLIFDEAYPENDADLRQMPKRFAALAQWYELTWGNRVNTRSELLQLCRDADLTPVAETSFSRFHIMVAMKG